MQTVIRPDKKASHLISRFSVADLIQDPLVEKEGPYEDTGEVITELKWM